MVDNKLCQLFFKYGLAQNKLDNIFLKLYEKYSKLEEDNPIEHLKYRIKSIDSIEEKLIKLKKRNPKDESKYEFTAENIEENLGDVLGYRVVCPFLSDVYKVIEDIKKISEIQILEERDYIKTPKRSGYSSYHLKTVIPVQLPDKVELVKAEIQVRTITMDMLASLEHRINYKKNVTLSETMDNKLKETVKFCNYVDRDLNNVLLEEREKKTQIEENKVLPDFINSEAYKTLTKKKEQALLIMNEKINRICSNYVKQKMKNPIEHVKCRIKSDNRIIEKLKRQNKPMTFENVESKINDIAGIRIVCPFLDNVEEIIQELKADTDIKIIQEQDFMDTPKDNGYASYHMLVLVPVETLKGTEYTKVEIQIRTMPQEMWAILQERLCYQKEVGQELPEDLKRLANVLADVDNNMNEMIKYSRKQQEKNKKKKVLSKQI